MGSGRRLARGLAPVALALLAGCGEIGGVPGFGDPITLRPRTCAELRASDLIWSIKGFKHGDILNPDVRNQTQLTVVLRVGQFKPLTLTAGSAGSTEDCSGKAASIQWVVSNPVVARLHAGASAQSATLEALQPGDVSVSAILTFQDGTSPMQVLPYAIATFGGAPVTVIRVVP
jgi:hypothetical protein